MGRIFFLTLPCLIAMHLITPASATETTHYVRYHQGGEDRFGISDDAIIHEQAGNMFGDMHPTGQTAKLD